MGLAVMDGQMGLVVPVLGTVGVIIFTAVVSLAANWNSVLVTLPNKAWSGDDWSRSEGCRFMLLLLVWY